MDPIIGQIMLWPVSAFIPVGWQLCDGTLLSVQQYTALFSLLGTTYGGDGQKNFAVPDLRHRVPVGSQYAGETGHTTSPVNPPAFTPNVSIGVNNLPPHAHPATFTPGGGTSQVNIAIPAVANPTSTTEIPGDTVSLAKSIDSSGGGATPVIYSSDSPGTNTLKPFPVSVPAGGGTVAVGNTGAGQALPVAVPYLTMNYIIATAGIYPERP